MTIGVEELVRCEKFGTHLANPIIEEHAKLKKCVHTDIIKLRLSRCMPELT
jgi:hypothetical protein